MLVLNIGLMVFVPKPTKLVNFFLTHPTDLLIHHSISSSSFLLYFLSSISFIFYNFY